VTPERFRQVRNLFEAALEKGPLERLAFLDQAALSDDDLRAQVGRMLDAHERTVTFLNGSDSAPAELRTDPRRLEGCRLQHYEILREIGHGGMGTVYLARRADGLFQQQVAIKVVTPEMAAGEVIQRFEQERAILASLEHPYIARLYDGGATEEGWPYFVMEYVEGRPIDEWCDAQKLNISERLRLFRMVCAAVHFAHQHRVIHRDLKPGNILVTADGTVKLLDFGIAKLAEVQQDGKTALTRTGMRMMTPEYASPEQVRGEANTPFTDIYSLGVILYELLTGRRPYRLKSRVFHEIVRVVCEEPPARPSTIVTEADERPGDEGKTITIAPSLLSRTREGTPSDLKRRLRGDLDHILLKALEKDPRRRYRSADQMSADLERHLMGQPVAADPSGRFSDLARAVSRHHLSVVLALMLLIALLTGGVRVDWRGIALASGTAVFLALWRLATDRGFGTRVSEYIYGMDAFFVFVFAVIFLVVITVSPYFLPAWSSDEFAGALFLAVGLALLFYMGFLIGFWMLRGRWAGPRIWSTRTTDRPIYTLGVSLFLNTVVNLARSRQMSDSDLLDNVAFLALSLSVFIYGVVIFPVFEVRERGLLHRGRFTSWLKIEKYEWESTAYPQDLVIFSLRPPRAALRLHVSRLFTFLPSPRIRVPADKQDELEAIMKRHLSEWPES
jgi:serine/threonine protein kinase